VPGEGGEGTVGRGRHDAGLQGQVGEGCADGPRLRYSITVDDATADDRMVPMESNWQVCSQDPAAGAALNGQPVTFTAVKFEESCP
jgi:hypothetical protein